MKLNIKKSILRQVLFIIGAASLTVACDSNDEPANDEDTFYGSSILEVEDYYQQPEEDWDVSVKYQTPLGIFYKDNYYLNSYWIFPYAQGTDCLVPTGVDSVFLYFNDCYMSTQSRQWSVEYVENGVLKKEKFPEYGDTIQYGDFMKIIPDAQRYYSSISKERLPERKAMQEKRHIFNVELTPVASWKNCIQHIRIVTDLRPSCKVINNQWPHTLFDDNYVKEIEFPAIAICPGMWKDGQSLLRAAAYKTDFAPGDYWYDYFNN